MALLRAVSETTFADTFALLMAPHVNAKPVTRNAAPYRTLASVLARNMMYPTITKGAQSRMMICRRSVFQLMSGSRILKKTPTA